jgi:prenyltransferase beta subunit
LEKVDREATARYLGALVREDGSVAPSIREKDRAALGSTFHGVGALVRLGRLDLLDKDKTAAFVLTHRAADDGFAMTSGGNSSPQAVAMAVGTLARLGALTSDVREGAVRYLEGAIAFLGTLGPRYRSLATMQSATAIVDSLVAMDALGEVDTAKVRDFVVSLYVPQNGGFGPSPGLGTAPPTTYQGVRCLAELGVIKPE